MVIRRKASSLKCFVLLTGLMMASPVQAQVSADFSQGGTLRLGTSNTACDSSTRGAIRWSSIDRTIEMCDGTTSWRKIIGNITVPAVSSPDPNKGFFVLTAETFNSNLGNITGAHAKCLTDLTNYNWNGKTEAISRGLLNSTKVRAWLCVGSACQNMVPNVNYQFAVSGAPNKGGATIKVAADGVTHNNTQNWSGYNYWGAATYFTGRTGGGVNTVFGGTIYNPCRNWTYTGPSGSDYGPQANSNSTGTERWNTTQYSTCNQLHKLVCLVDP